MKASDLRIGNLIYNPVQKINLVVDGGLIATESMREKAIKDYKGFEPIPLTEEWLLRFGFEEETVFKSKKFILNNFFIVTITERSVIYVNLKNNTFRIDLKHVHQLQNLYHALTGEELEIKPLQP